jgi:hypothetical protein
LFLAANLTEHMCIPNGYRKSAQLNEEISQGITSWIGSALRLADETRTATSEALPRT